MHGINFQNYGVQAKRFRRFFSSPPGREKQYIPQAAFFNLFALLVQKVGGSYDIIESKIFFLFSIMIMLNRKSEDLAYFTLCQALKPLIYLFI